MTLPSCEFCQKHTAHFAIDYQTPDIIYICGRCYVKNQSELRQKTYLGEIAPVWRCPACGQIQFTLAGITAEGSTESYCSLQCFFKHQS